MNKKTLIILSVAVIIIILFASLYKLVYEPYSLKKQYLICIETAKNNDYHLWQKIEEEIKNQDTKVKNLGIETDKKRQDFYDNYKTKNEYVEYMESCTQKFMNSNTFLDDVRRSKLEINGDHGENFCKGQRRDEIERSVRNEQNILNNLYEKRDKNGEILEHDMRECKEQYELFK
jgi:hypothetical protein